MVATYSHAAIEDEALKCWLLCGNCNQRKTDLEVAAKLKSHAPPRCYTAVASSANENSTVKIYLSRHTGAMLSSYHTGFQQRV